MTPIKNLMLVGTVAMTIGSVRAELSSADYVQNGLRAQWDGIDNTLQNGVRSHSNSPAVWSDLTGNGHDIPFLPDFVEVDSDSMLSKAIRGLSDPTAINASKNDLCPTLDEITGVNALERNQSMTIEIVSKREGGWIYTDNYGNLQTVLATPRGSVGYRQNNDNGYYWAGPLDGSSIHYADWNVPGKLVTDLHTISAVEFLNNNFGYMDGVGTGKFTSGEVLSSWATAKPAPYTFFGNLRADIRIYAIRVYNRVLTPDEFARNARLDRIRFGGETEQLRIRPLADVPSYVSGLACAPEPVVESAVTCEALGKGIDYDVSYSNNCQSGFATVTVTGKGAWAGRSASQNFVVDSGETYQALDYIESSGTQFIDTGYLPTAATEMQSDIYLSGDCDFTLGGGYLFGCGEGDKRFSINFGSTIGSERRLYAWLNTSGSAVNRIDFTEGIGARLPLLARASTGLVRYGSLCASGAKKTAAHTDGQQTLILFGYKSPDKSVVPFSYYRMRVYGCKISEGGVLKRDFTPCRRLFDGEVGLYDRVTKRFYGNGGTGVFAAGLPDATLPTGYRRLDSIRSTGTQYIDTGYIANPTTYMSFDMQLGTDARTDQIGTFFGARDSDGTRFNINLGSGNNSKQWFVWLNAGSDTPIRRFNPSDDINFNRTLYTVDAATGSVLNNGVGMSPMNTGYTTGVPKTTTNASSLCLFGVHNEDGTFSPMAERDMTIWSWRIYDGEPRALVRDFMPCLREADGHAGLFDLVNGVFYPNANPNSTDGFAYDAQAAVLEQPVLPEGYQRVKALLATGRQAVSAGVKASDKTTTMAMVTPQLVKEEQRVFSAWGYKTVEACISGEYLYEASVGNDLCWAAACGNGTWTDGQTYLTSTETVAAGEPVSVILDPSARGLYVGGKKVLSLAQPTTGTVSSDDITFLRGGSYDSHWGSGLLTGAWIWDNGTLVRQLVPCFRKSDGMTGLYDLVEDQFHPSVDEPLLLDATADIGTACFSGRVKEACLTTTAPYLGLSTFSFVLWTKNPDIQRWSSSANDAYGVLLSNGAMGTSVPGFCCFVARDDVTSSRLTVQLRTEANTTTSLSVPLSRLGSDCWSQVAFVCDWENKQAGLYLNGFLVDSKSGADLVDPALTGSNIGNFTIGTDL